LIELVAVELQAIGPTRFGAQGSARHETPRRFVWVPMESPLRGPRRSSRSGEHVVDGIGLKFAVECWGWNFDDAFYLVAALLTAIQKAWRGRNYLADQVLPWEQRERESGFVLAVEVEMLLDVPAVDLSQPPPPRPAKSTALDAPAEGPAIPDDPAPTFGAQGETTVQITDVAQATPATSTPGDGVLESEET
ncbi:MAG: hypothetical protein MUF64_33270, partial [Polyangiaceae bacterium]|nr:hypothetical protein [Polyangiaceae bacterium]